MNIGLAVVVFIWVSTIVIGFLSMVWSKKTLVNLIIKFVLLVISILGVYILWTNAGFVTINPIGV